MGIVNPSGFRSISDIDLTVKGGAEDAVLLIDEASRDIGDIRLEIGSFEKNTLQRTMQNVETETLESAVHEADFKTPIVQKKWQT